MLDDVGHLMMLLALMAKMDSLSINEALQSRREEVIERLI